MPYRSLEEVISLKMRSRSSSSLNSISILFLPFTVLTRTLVPNARRSDLATDLNAGGVGVRGVDSLVSSFLKAGGRSPPSREPTASHRQASASASRALPSREWREWRAHDRQSSSPQTAAVGRARGGSEAKRSALATVERPLDITCATSDCVILRRSIRRRYPYASSMGFRFERWMFSMSASSSELSSSASLMQMRIF